MQYKVTFIVLLIVSVIAIDGGVLLYQSHQNTQQANIQSQSKTDILLKKIETELQKNPKEIKIYIALSQVYLQKVRETSDSSYYEKVDALLTKAQKIDPKYADIYATKAMVDYGRHNFKTGLENAQKATQYNPDKPSYYGLIGDADIELGSYNDAVIQFQKMVDIRPDYNSYTRIAYIRELYGDINGAKEAEMTAISAGSSFPENVAWSYVELGKLDARDNPLQATKDFNHALATYPNYSPALEGLGKIAAAKKDYKNAINYFEKAFTILPVAAYAMDTGDAATKVNDTKKAQQQYFLTKLAFEKSTKSGVNIDLENALFLADHNMDLGTALKQAQTSYKIRASINGADVLAWALYKNNRFDEAQKYSTEALRLGEFDPQILFHAGMIDSKTHQEAEAKRLLTKALAISPYFSIIQTDVAHETLKAL
ncbi:MAG: hypothetical protein ACR2LN_01595 [Candidatus Levyibacteriota bacterium]